MEITTSSPDETKEFGRNFAQKITKIIDNEPVVLALQGELGGGKTTFIQGFAKGLGICERITSPTFIIINKHKIKNIEEISTPFNFLYHMDCYRINDEADLGALNFNEMITTPGNIVAIEWAERIKNALPDNTINIKFKELEKNKRKIIVDRQV